MERHQPDIQPQPTDTYMDMVRWVNRYLKLKYHLVAEGLENIPDGAAMFVANHLRFDDSFAIAAVYANHTGKPLRLGAKKEYFEGKGINNKGLLGKPIQKFVTNTQQLPVNRGNDLRGSAELARGVKHRFGIGEPILLHGEGTRSIDGRLNRLYTGGAAFAIKYGVPLGPTSITYESMPMSFRQAAVVQFGELLETPDYGMEFHHHLLLPDSLVDAVTPRVMNQRERAEKVTDILEERIAHMSGQDRSGYFLDPYTKELIIPEDDNED